MTYSKYLMICLMGMIVLSFPSCDGILEDIYDHPTSRIEVGFNNVDKTKHTGTLYVNASDLMRWIYVDFHAQTLDTVQIDTAGMELLPDEPQNWDFALHRYDVKTNGGSAVETDFTNLDAFMASGVIPEFGLKNDVMDSVLVDMSHMAEGYMINVESPVNQELGKWLDVDTSNMPPTFTLSNKVYVVRLKDNTYAAMKLVNFMNENGDRGYMYIDYVYPIEAK